MSARVWLTSASRRSCSASGCSSCSCSDESSASLSDCCIGTSASAAGVASATPPTSSVGGSAAGGSATPSAAACAQQSGLRSRPWRLLSTCSAWGRLHRVDGTLAMPRAAYERFGNHPWERRSRQSFRGGETGARRCAERSPGSPGGEMADLFTWVGRAAHGGHAPRRCRDGYPIPDVSDGRPSKWY